MFYKSKNDSFFSSQKKASFHRLLVIEGGIGELMLAVCIQLLFASLCITSVWAQFPDGATWETAHCGKKYLPAPSHYFPLHNFLEY
jgi:hypothetical protein